MSKSLVSLAAGLSLLPSLALANVPAKKPMGQSRYVMVKFGAPGHYVRRQMLRTRQEQISREARAIYKRQMADAGRLGQ